MPQLVPQLCVERKQQHLVHIPIYEHYVFTVLLSGLGLHPISIITQLLCACQHVGQGVHACLDLTTCS